MEERGKERERLIPESLDTEGEIQSLLGGRPCKSIVA